MHIELHTHIQYAHKQIYVRTHNACHINKKNTKTTKMYTIVDIYIFIYTTFIVRPTIKHQQRMY